MAGALTNDRLLPGGLALRGFAPALDPDWNCWMDENLLRLSTLSQGSVISQDAELPTAPADGAVFIVPSGAASNANEVAVRDDGAYVFYAPFPGLTLFVVTENRFVSWNGTAWVVNGDLNGGGGGMSLVSLSDTPNDLTGQVGRQLVVNPGESGFIFRDIPYDIPVFTPGRPAAGSIIRILISRNMVIPDNFAGSVAMAGFAAQATTVFVVRRSGAAFGTITFAAGVPGGTFAFDTPGSDQAFSTGESLEIVNPDPQDESIQDMSYTFLGRQT